MASPSKFTNALTGHGADRKGAISKLPSLFERLIEGGEKPHVAVRKVVALLVGNGE